MTRPMSEQELITKRLKGCIAKMDRMYKAALKRACKWPDDHIAQENAAYLREFFGW